MGHLPEAACTLPLLNLHEGLDNDLASHSVLVPARHEIHDLRALVVLHDLTVDPSPHLTLVPQLREQLPLFSIVLPIERQHVLVLADEVVVEDDCLLFRLLLILSQRQNCQHIIVVVKITLTLVVVDQAILCVDCSNIDLLLDASIPLPFNLLAVSVVHLLQL